MYNCFSSDNAEEFLFERYRDIAEATIGRRVIISVNIKKDLSLHLKAIMRAAVYGHLSILFKGILTVNDLKRVLSITSESFCELEAEEREFNGYIPKGIYVDTPYLLDQKICGYGIDLCFFDIERLLFLMTDGTDIANDELQSYITNRIVNFKASLPDIKYSVILGNRTNDRLFMDKLIQNGISDFYSP